MSTSTYLTCERCGHDRFHDFVGITTKGKDVTIYNGLRCDKCRREVPVPNTGRTPDVSDQEREPSDA